MISGVNFYADNRWRTFRVIVAVVVVVEVDEVPIVSSGEHRLDLTANGNAGGFSPIGGIRATIGGL